jgi:hypothetical protein
LSTVPLGEVMIVDIQVVVEHTSATHRRLKIQVIVIAECSVRSRPPNVAAPHPHGTTVDNSRVV